MPSKHQKSHFHHFNGQPDSKTSIQWYNLNIRTEKVNKVTLISKLSHASKRNQRSTDWFDKAADYFGNCWGENSRWMNEWMRNKQPWNQHQTSYLKPMDWARLEIPGGGRLRDQGGGSAKRVFGFFSSQRYKESNRNWGFSKARGYRDRGGILRSECSVFFPPNGAKSLIVNRMRFNQCWSGIWSTYLKESKLQDD